MRKVPLGNGLFAIVDDSDFRSVSKFKWHAVKIHQCIYAYGRPNGERMSMHQFIIQAPKGCEIDHRNSNGLDNRRGNFRITTHQKNRCNSRKLSPASSRFKGVYANRKYYKTTRFEVRITHKQKHFWIGIFDDEIEAAKAYDKKARELFGEFALCNFD